MESQNIWETDMAGNNVNTIKEELNTNITLDFDPEYDGETLNPEENIDDDQLNVKEEYIMPNYESDHEHIEKSNIDITEAVSNKLVSHLESITGQSNFSKNADVKMEQFDNLTDEYPNIDDGSMDSDEARALNNVEACLQDEIDIKHEHNVEHLKEDLQTFIKRDPDLTVTETNLISNKVINTTSTITNPHAGIIQSETTKTLVMEIHPMVQGVKIPMLRNPEEILSTSYSTDSMLHEESFQLNSITGNVLSLEQEAYGLLKEGHCDYNDKRYHCEKCPKSYSKSKGLREHMKVHDTIERRALGVIKGLQTKKANLEKRLYGVQKRVKKIDIQALKKKMERSERAENRTKVKSERKPNLKKEKSEKLANLKKETEEKITNLKKELEEQPSDVQKDGHKCICGKIFKRKSSLLACLRSHEISTDANSCFPCISCTKQFKDKEELAAHRRRMHRKRFPCKFCPTDYNTRKELFKHLQIHQKVQLTEYKVISEFVKGKQKLKCFMCSKSFSELSDLKYHVMEDHQEPYICPHCNGTFAKIIDFGNHTKAFHPEVEGKSVLDVLEAFSKLVQAWKCEDCNEQFHEADKFAMHQVEKHSPDVKDRDQFQCEDCRRMFISQKGLTSHKRIHHNTEVMEETEPQEQGVMCVECRKICKDDNALASHMRLHSPERQYPCKFCDFRFATSEKLKNHSEIHTGDMKYVCFICEYQCSSENRLEHHKMSLKHANMKEFLRTGKHLLEEESTSKKRESKQDDREVKKRKEHKDKKKEHKDKKKEHKDKKKEHKDKKKEHRDVNEEAGCSKEETVICDVCGGMFASEELMVEHKETHPFIVFPNEDTPTRIFFK
ncbi:zinc finger protein 271 [Bicyclus anynana]|uniref:Zinc finger protein 271 n=1 Tax=Bicyclus anynana TaxID=110368 RepID=A0A6J1PA08_BICAN|nr:zinc finger protein 271 [Bicyclus anynana]XP_023954544.1 zinc finger protein 271 [Bicyclus anynana]XP_052742734.1 zinc finger protein 271 [Bicyclus anynana]